MATVLPFTSEAGPVDEVSPVLRSLVASVAFDAIVAALIKFDVETGRLTAEPTPLVRQQYRGVIAQLINERSREHADVAERAALAVLGQCHEALSGCNAPDLYDVRLALAAYRGALQRAPVIGLGQS